MQTVAAQPLPAQAGQNPAPIDLEPGTELRAKVESNLPGGLVRLTQANSNTRLDLRVPAPLPVGADVVVNVSGSRQQPQIQITVPQAPAASGPSAETSAAQNAPAKAAPPPSGSAPGPASGPSNGQAANAQAKTGQPANPAPARPLPANSAPVLPSVANPAPASGQPPASAAVQAPLPSQPQLALPLTPSVSSAALFAQATGQAVPFAPQGQGAGIPAAVPLPSRPPASSGQAPVQSAVISNQLPSGPQTVQAPVGGAPGAGLVSAPGPAAPLGQAPVVPPQPGVAASAPVPQGAAVAPSLPGQTASGPVPGGPQPPLTVASQGPGGPPAPGQAAAAALTPGATGQSSGAQQMAPVAGGTGGAIAGGSAAGAAPLAAGTQAAPPAGQPVTAQTLPAGQTPVSSHAPALGGVANPPGAGGQPSPFAAGAGASGQAAPPSSSAPLPGSGQSAPQGGAVAQPGSQMPGAPASGPVAASPPAMSGQGPAQISPSQGGLPAGSSATSQPGSGAQPASAPTGPGPSAGLMSGALASASGSSTPVTGHFSQAYTGAYPAAGTVSGGIPGPGASGQSAPGQAPQIPPGASASVQKAATQLARPLGEQQAGLASLFAQIGALASAQSAGQVSLPEPVQKAMQQILGLRLNSAQMPTAEDLQTAMRQSGQFREAGLLRAAGPQTSALPDLKSALMSFRALLQHLGADSQVTRPARQPSVPTRKGGPEGQAPQRAGGFWSGAAPQNLQALMKETDAALARMRLTQLVNAGLAGDDGPQAASARAMDTVVELPIAFGQETGVLQMQIGRDGANKEEDGEADSAWRLRFAMDLTATGPIEAAVTLRGGGTYVSLWVDRKETLDTLKGLLDTMEAAFADAGLDLQELRFMRGLPPKTAAKYGSLINRQS